ncbi:hypothetical protein RclHR1_12580003 [Rhizophagus clarus]|uniref:Uncharacterized protein n=1 Tax=Rhizophagus clarus TaxID=94130 RepID=A0A2Z6Q986_9GLOM|nr:hypothetical protein RclHR1_12580003 [Rhizophagus clarus]GES90181.1 hypothetical protein GLOIN_2v907553 [Rhizophagus clarus]
MPDIKKYEFQYQYFNISSNSQPSYGILDLSQENSIISLNRLRKHQNDITKYSIKHLTKSSFEQQYHNLDYDNVEGILVDFHILIGIEKFDITLKKILVVKEIEGEDKDERIEFRLGNDFLKEFDAEVEEVGNEILLHRLKFTVQLKGIKDSKSSSSVIGSIKSIKDKKKFKESFSYYDNYLSMIAIIAFATFLSAFVLNMKSFEDESPIFEDKIKLLIDLEKEINSFNISLNELKQSEISIIDLTRNSNKVLTSNRKILINTLNLQELTSKTRISYEMSLDYYGNTLWKLKELNIKKVLFDKTDSLFDRLFSFIFMEREYEINETEFGSYYSLLNRYLDKFSNKEDFLQQITNMEKGLNQLQKNFKNVLNDISNDDGTYKKFFETVSTIIFDNFKNLQSIKFKLKKLKENNIVIGYIFIKLKEDFARILKDRSFNHDEYEQIHSYLSTIRYNREKFLRVAGLSVK